MLGNDKLKDTFGSLGNRPLDEIKEGILTMLEDYATSDDVTMVLVRRSK